MRVCIARWEGHNATTSTAATRAAAAANVQRTHEFAGIRTTLLKAGA